MRAKTIRREIEKEQPQPSHMKIKSMRGQIYELFFVLKRSPREIAKELGLDEQQVCVAVNKMRS